MIKIMEENELVNIYRFLFGDKPLYTWQKPNSTKRARLDYFLISENMKNNVKRHGHRNFISSDHRPIEITLKFDDFIEGKGLWRHKDKLLHDNDYHVYIKRVICDTLAKYIIMPGYDNFYEQASLEDMQRFSAMSHGEK